MVIRCLMAQKKTAPIKETAFIVSVIKSFSN